jgi:hypothetical protein
MIKVNRNIDELIKNDSHIIVGFDKYGKAEFKPISEIRQEFNYFIKFKRHLMSINKK